MLQLLYHKIKHWKYTFVLFYRCVYFFNFDTRSKYIQAINKKIRDVIWKSRQCLNRARYKSATKRHAEASETIINELWARLVVSV